MEQSSQGTDGPLLPKNPDNRHFSSGSGDPPTSLSLNQPRQGPREGFSGDDHHVEVDIADPGAQIDEKAGDPSAPPPNTGNFKSASVEEEQQAVDWIVPIRNGGLVEKRVSGRVFACHSFLMGGSSYSELLGKGWRARCLLQKKSSSNTRHEVHCLLIHP